jgi:hypothetical protein
MVTNYPQTMTASRNAGEVADIADDADVVHRANDTDGLGERVLDRLRQALCGLHGHDTLRQFEQDRMFLRCISCGHETPGWELNEAPPTVTVRGDHRRHMLARPQLIRERNVA